jgi:hypothetical protein
MAEKYFYKAMRTDGRGGYSSIHGSEGPYAVGATYTVTATATATDTATAAGKPALCARGFHGCLAAADCWSPEYGYDVDADVLAVVQLFGEMVTDGVKAAARCMTVIRILPRPEMLALCTGVVERANGDRLYYTAGRLDRAAPLPAIVRANGDTLWYRAGKIYREGGPAVVLSDGSRAYYVDGERHGEFICSSGNKSYWAHDQLHREDGGPALVLVGGYCEWRVHGRRHRDGNLPAVVYSFGRQEFWQYGKRVS